MIHLFQGLPVILSSHPDKAAQQITTIFGSLRFDCDLAQRVQNSSVSLGIWPVKFQSITATIILIKRTANLFRMNLLKLIKKTGYLYSELNKRISDISTVLRISWLNRRFRKIELYSLLKSIQIKIRIWFSFKLGKWYDTAKETLDDFYKSDTASRAEQEDY